MKRQVWLTTLIGLLAIGCGDDTTATSDTDTDTEGTTSTTGDPTMPTTMPGTSTTEPGTSTTDPGTDTEDPGTDTEEETDTEDPTDTEDTNNGEPAEFLITIENISDQGPLPTAFSPGVWIEQDSTAAPVFNTNTAASAALELLAEDGDPSTLATDIEGNAAVMQSGVFDTPVDGMDPAPIQPGESYEIQFTAQPESRLGLASMVVATNDVFWATGPAGVSLFLPNGDPVERDITTFINLYDAGTEAQQTPGAGSFQPVPMGDPNVGPGEGDNAVVSVRGESTRAIVGAGRILDIDVEYILNEAEDEILGLRFTFTNISDNTGGFVTPLSPVSWALHDDTFSLLTPGGAAADLAGLEALAEDGDGTTLETTLGGTMGVGGNGIGGAAPFGPGESITFDVVPTETADTLSFATMIVESNDAVIALEPAGVALLGDDGMGNLVYRNPDTIAEDLLASMTVWDMGTEANQTPGAGPDQPGPGVDPDTGDADPDATIRYYFDGTNDLASLEESLLVGVNILGGNVSVQLASFSDDTAFAYTISPGVGAMSAEGVTLFELGAAASAGLESLAEDGSPTAFVAELEADAMVGEVVESLAIAPGGDDTFTFDAPSSDQPVLHFAAMIVPSNDTFVSTGPDGVNIFNDAGDLLEEAEIAAAIEAALVIYDAGTERNQIAAVGADMAPFQAMANTGEPEGNGLVRVVTQGANGELSNEPVWEYPRLDQMIRVTVAPVAR